MYSLLPLPFKSNTQTQCFHCKDNIFLLLELTMKMYKLEHNYSKRMKPKSHPPNMGKSNNFLDLNTTNQQIKPKYVADHPRKFF
ncbi:hypothetical protein Sjap_019059 [Stephania japonica]|uniref:Uncharacterized protein n=1 Tax=Stephania japonica TaxID=461633 RepID=A0AAP0HZ59_9MAGN